MECGCSARRPWDAAAERTARRRPGRPGEQHLSLQFSQHPWTGIPNHTRLARHSSAFPCNSLQQRAHELWPHTPKGCACRTFFLSKTQAGFPIGILQETLIAKLPEDPRHPQLPSAAAVSAAAPAEKPPPYAERSYDSMDSVIAQLEASLHKERPNR